jgi:hypothetical protein
MTGSFPAAPQMASPDLIRRPLRDLLTGLPALPVTESGQPDYAAADPDVLVSLARSAELVLQIVHDSFSAIGLLHACTAQQIAHGDIGANHAVAVGRLQVELGEVLAYAQTLSFECRRYTADYFSDGRGTDDG